MSSLVVLAASTGCASISSIDPPWKTSPQVDDESADASSDPASESQGEETTDETTRERATYWARKAVSASQQLAYARQLRHGTETENRAATARSGESSPSSPASSSGTDAEASSNGAAANGSAESSSKSTPRADSEPTGSDARTAPAASPTAGLPSSADRKPNFRTVERRREIADAAPRAEGWPVGRPDDNSTAGDGPAPTLPRLDREVYDLTRSDDRDAFQEEYDLDPSEIDGDVAIPGTYFPPSLFENYEDDEFRGFDDLTAEQKRDQVAVVAPGEEVTVYAGTEPFASLEFEADAELPDDLMVVEPVRVIEDGTTQLLTYWPEQSEHSDEQTVRVKAGVLKVIGPFVGKIFEEPVARSPSGDPQADLERTNYVEFLRDEDDSETLIRVTPADSGGEPAGDEARIFEWNPWEGVFRVPKPPPTAPDQRS